MDSESIVAYATLITALVAVIGVIITVWKQLAQQETDKRRQLDERFTSIITSLGSNSQAIQAGAAVSIITFLKPEYKIFHDQVFMVLLANLKLKNDIILNRLLVTGFQKAIRIKNDLEKDKSNSDDFDLSYCNLYRIDLSGMNLSNADIGFAKLQGANLTNTNLRRIQGWESNLERARLSNADMEEARLRKAHLKGVLFHNARLVSADLRETDLTKARFYQAKLQSAHFDKANLDSTKFEQADINDAYFYGVHNLNESTLKSIYNSYNWQKAHFDDNVRIELEKIAETNSK
jgi:uncharacterized protein YjbI with pentapeptide repeats